LVHRINEYQRRVDKARNYFNNLVKEPNDLVDRVAACKEEMDSVNSDPSADRADRDPDRERTSTGLRPGQGLRRERDRML
jgi:hypothetical protein